MTQDAENDQPDVVKIAGYVSISKEIAEDFRLIREALSAPVSREAWDAWLAEDDDTDYDEDWFCTDECDHAAGVYQCEQSDGSEGG